MQYLLMWAKEDAGLHQVALPIFCTAVSLALDPLTASSAAQGIEVINGPEKGRTAWLSLLNHSDEQIVAGAVFSLNDNSYVSDLLDLLNRRSETYIHSAIISTLGRMRDPRILSVILEHLARPETQSNAILALERLEEPDAIPHLEPLMRDNAESGIADDRGVMLTTGTLASRAVRRLRYAAEHKTNAEIVPPLNPSGQSARNLIAFAPLVAAFLEVVWFALVIFVQLFTTGTVAKDETQKHQLDVIAMIPATVGLLIGLIVIAQGRTQRRVEKVCLYFGCLACGAATFCFSWEYFH
jgi:HEAT repeats